MKIVFATQNENKIREVQVIVPSRITLLSLKDIGCTEEIPETGNTLEENAILKANYVTTNYGYDCFADDTGLLVDVLKGEPGVYSARYAGAHKSAENNMAKLLSELQGQNKRTARFKTVIALNLNGNQNLFEGKIEGKITKSKQGEGGFGYDPIFIPNGFDRTFAELPLVIKNEIGHRGRATQKLISYLKSIEYVTGG